MWLESTDSGDNSEAVYPANRLTEIAQTLASIRATIKTSGIKHISTISSMLLPVDDMLQNWRDQLPPSWVPRPDPSCLSPECALHAHIERGPSDVYPDLWIASIWNNYRAARIIIHETLLSSSMVCKSTIPVAGGQITNHSIVILREMSAEICRSVEYHLRPAIISSPYDASIQQRRMIPGGHLLIWPLFMAGKLPTTNSKYRFWISDLLSQIGISLGIRLAMSLSETLRQDTNWMTFSETELWNLP
jgi:hypothetical protein